MSTAQPIFEEVEGALHDAQALLDQGRAAEASELLSRVHAAVPSDERVRNLLAMVSFKAGDLPRAAELYLQLIEENPADPSLRLNLGLVRLKMGALPEAVQALETALELDPEHARARNYLGVALGQLGDYARAKEQFLLAGSKAQADRMAQALQATEGLEAEGQDAEVSLTAEEMVPEGEVVAEGLSAWAGQQQPAFKAPAEREDGGVLPFRAEGGSLWVALNGQLWLKPAGLRVSSGSMRWVPGVKRFGGKYSDRPLGEGRDRIFMVEGQGSLFLAEEKGRTLTVLDMGDEDAFFQLRGVFGLEGTMPFENGRLPSGRAQLDLEWMQVRGPGSIVLSYPGPVSAVEVRPGAPIQVPLVHLAGWYGQLSTRLTALWEGEGGMSSVELTGEGVALWVMPDL